MDPSAAKPLSKKQDEFQVVDLSMMDLRWFLPLSGSASFTVQTMTYPFALLRTRLQLQQGKCVYRGLSHAATSILRDEGFKGLYRGYFVKSGQFVSTIVYACVYETVRQQVRTLFRQHTATANRIEPLSSFIGGAAAAMSAQTLVVPLDVISQHLMVLSLVRGHPSLGANATTVTGPASALSYGVQLSQVRSLTPIRLSAKELASGWSRFRGVFRYVAKHHGVRGFYKGFLISLCSVVPNSALWWAFYDTFCRLIAPMFVHSNSPDSSRNDVLVSPYLSRLAAQIVSAPLAGMCSAMIVNPIDCIRVRMQVGHVDFRTSVHTLWQTEGFKWFTKGLSARLLQSGIFSFWLVIFYEPLKIFCLKTDYRERFRRSGRIL